MRFAKNTLVAIFICFLFVAPTVHAQSAVFQLPECVDTGDCQLNDMVNTLINVAEFLLGISGSLALLMFIYGGFIWVTSGGSEERITKGKEAVRNAIIGLIIVFLAFAVIQFALNALSVSDKFNLLKGAPGQEVKQ